MGLSYSKRKDVLSDIDALNVSGREVFIETAFDLGKKLPVVGGLIDLLKQVKDKYREISTTVKEMSDVAVWAENTLVQFESIELSLLKQGVASPMDDLMKRLLLNAKEKIYNLIEIADHVLEDKNYESIRGALFKSEFTHAKEAFDNAKSNLQEAMISSIYIEVLKMREMMEKMYNDSIGTCSGGNLDCVEDSSRQVISRSSTC
tara:strand:- start:4 stop:615 length:612 start_codon:yes stop_codon:yes gene_type:complete